MHAVLRLCNDFSQRGHRPACDPAGAIYRLAQDDCAQAMQRLLARASTCSPAALPEQFNVLLRTASPFSCSASTDSPATLPSSLTSCSGRPPPSPLLHPTHPTPSSGAGQTHRRRTRPCGRAADLHVLPAVVTHTLCGHAVGGCNPHDACGVHQRSEERPLGKPCLRESLAKFSSPELPHRLYSL